MPHGILLKLTFLLLPFSFSPALTQTDFLYLCFLSYHFQLLAAGCSLHHTCGSCHESTVYTMVLMRQNTPEFFLYNLLFVDLGQWKGVGGSTESDPWKISFALSVTIGYSLQLDAGNC